VKFVKTGMYVAVVRDMPDPRFLHAQVTAVADQDAITVVYGDVEYAATRLSDPPNWRVNKFGAGT